MWRHVPVPLSSISNMAAAILVLQLEEMQTSLCSIRFIVLLYGNEGKRVQIRR